LTSLLGDDSSRTLLLYTPVVSTSDQHARLVLDTRAPVKAWLNGREIALPAAGESPVREVELDIPKGTNTLLIRLNGGTDVSLVTTLVASQPIEFSASEVTPSAGR
jgi:hypothetical protein